MSTNRQASRCAFLLGTLLVAACTRTCQQEEPLPGQRHAVPSPVPDAGAPGSAVTEAKPGVRPTVARVSPVDGGAASSAWPSDLPTRWFEVWKDDKGPFVPVDCANQPIRQMVYRVSFGVQQVVFRDLFRQQGSRAYFTLLEVRRKAGITEFDLAETSETRAETRLIHNGREKAKGHWLRDGKLLELHPMEELARWRVRRLCAGPPYLEDMTEATYVQEQYERHPERTPEFQGLPAQPAIDIVTWSDEVLRGIPRSWLELMPGDEEAILLGCDGGHLSTLLEFRSEGGVMVLERGNVVYFVRKLSRKPGLVHLSLAKADWGTSVEDEVEIRYEPGASQAQWTWRDVSEASEDTRRGLPWDLVRKLPHRTLCE